MRKKIGIRELKNELADVIRRVGEEQVEYTVTVHGRPVAVLRPLNSADAGIEADDEVQKELAEMAELARLIGENWSAPKGAIVLLQEMREGTDGDY
jgi:prevent-host-death family protein